MVEGPDTDSGPSTGLTGHTQERGYCIFLLHINVEPGGWELPQHLIKTHDWFSTMNLDLAYFLPRHLADQTTPVSSPVEIRVVENNRYPVLRGTNIGLDE